jgi:hypothetical protein
MVEKASMALLIAPLPMLNASWFPVSEHVTPDEQLKVVVALGTHVPALM